MFVTLSLCVNNIGLLSNPKLEREVCNTHTCACDQTIRCLTATLLPAAATASSQQCHTQHHMLH